jgi:hypothetical protein
MNPKVFKNAANTSELKAFGDMPAFPTQDGPFTDGMTIRCWLAGQALAALGGRGKSLTANEAVELADAVIARLNKDA